VTIAGNPHDQPPAITARIAAACERIAPTWPLDQFIAVNPYWGWRGSAAPHAAAMLGALAGTALTMPRAWFRSEHAAGRLAAEDIHASATSLGDPTMADAALDVLLQSIDHAQPVLHTMALATDVRDLGGPPQPGQTWADLVTHQISQHCAAHFDRWQGSWHPSSDADLFSGWRIQLSASHGVKWRHGAGWARTQIAALPAQPGATIAELLDALAIPEAGQESYLTALLLSVNGWAAWCAYRRWKARLVDADDDEIVGLLAIRIAWEWLLRSDAEARAGTEAEAAVWTKWTHSWARAQDTVHAIASEQRVDWVLQGAVERAYQGTLISALADAEPAPTRVPAVQAAFCIDVRSEVFRRALEAASPDAHTRGFAGFFGLPISYTPAGSALTRPQLPGLLTPALNVTDTTAHGSELERITNERGAALGNRRAWSMFRSAPSSVFSFVESMGLLYGPKLVKDSLARTAAPPKWENDGLSAESSARLRPHMSLIDDDPAAAAEIAERVLNAMGLTDGFAPLVLLCGHGSQTANNPHAAGLDCGACGGQTGEVNARALADLLNSDDVRAHLATMGVVVPVTTRFVPALHNTTTDEVQLFDTDLLPEDCGAQLSQLQQWLASAGDRARGERAASLDLGGLANSSEQLKQAILERANDWSQVRPEWGLAGNACFIVAPRGRTRHIDLAGRSFLHDYDWQLDSDLSVLTLIMTAPMVVTNWINMQYHASTVDNRRYGSGNKMLHNVVGGRLGVFEGNGGDLRLGLSMQSLHDGHTLRHPPLRLSVFIEAPRAGIDAVIDEHTVVHDLVANGWLHLLRIEPTTGDVERWTSDGWQPHR